MPDVRDLTGKTLGDLMLSLAVDVGVAELVDDDGNSIAPRLPTDASRLARLKSKVNDAYSALVSCIDPGTKTERPYTRWSFLNRPVTISLNPDGTGPQNIAGDSSRYRLPDGIQTNPPCWFLDSDGAYQGVEVVSRTPREVASRLAQVDSSSGCPSMAAVRAIENPEGRSAGAGWEVIVADRPGSAMTMTAQFRVSARPMQDLSERHICGSQHDRTIQLLALVEWARTDNRFAQQRAEFAQQASAALASSIALDRPMHASSIGVTFDPSNLQVPIVRGDVAASQRGIVSYAGQE